jgi:hypothetical protein
MQPHLLHVGYHRGWPMAAGPIPHSAVESSIALPRRPCVDHPTDAWWLEHFQARLRLDLSLEADRLWT